MSNYEFEIALGDQIELNDQDAELARECAEIFADSKETLELAKIVRDISRPSGAALFTST